MAKNDERKSDDFLPKDDGGIGRVDFDAKVIVRPLPKVVFFWPLWVVSILCLVVPLEAGIAGQVWMTAFLFNLLVIAADFNEDRSVIVVLTFAVAVTLLLWLGVLGDAFAVLGSVTPEMNKTFYACMAGSFTAIYAFVWIRSYFDYWEFRPKEVVHQIGFFPKMKRYSTESMRWQKEIPDVLERLLLGSGRLVMTTPYESHPIIIEHVAGISRKDEQIRQLLSVTRVVTEPPGEKK